MQRLDCQGHISGPRIVQQTCDSIGDLCAGGKDVSVSCSTVQYTRQTAHNQYETGARQLASFVHGTIVVLKSTSKPRGVGSSEHSAAAVTRKLQARLVD